MRASPETRTMRPAPPLPAAPAEAVVVPQARPRRMEPPPRPGARRGMMTESVAMPADAPSADASVARVFREQLALMGLRQREHAATQSSLHRDFLRSRTEAMRILAGGQPIGTAIPSMPAPAARIAPSVAACTPPTASPDDRYRFEPAPEAPRTERSYGPEQVAAFAHGRIRDCFGPGWLRTLAHTRTPRFAPASGARLGTIDSMAPDGGPWNHGYLRASIDLPGPATPAALLDAGLQAMAFHMTGLGQTIGRDGWRFEADPPASECGTPMDAPVTGSVTIEVFVRELVDGDAPHLLADILASAGERRIMLATAARLRLAPGWPLEDGSPLLETLAGVDARACVVDGFRYDGRSMLHAGTGRPSLAFGPCYGRFDGPMPMPRLPAPPFQFVTRVVELQGEFGSMRVGTCATMEYDIPDDAWYFAENGCRTMPVSVLMEAALQPCGWLASRMGGATTSDSPLLFRNLDGTGTQHAEVLPGGGPLRTVVRNRSLSRTPSMTLVGFDVECRRDDVLVYSLSTTFGFFPPSAFAGQPGLAVDASHRALLESGTGDRADLDVFRHTAGRPRLARPMLLMLDRVAAFDPRGGSAGLGSARGEKDVDPGEWFFKAHFFQDPVQPGSLGIEALVQLLQWSMLELGMDAGIESPRFEPFALGETLSWKYRGQVLPENARVTTTIEITGRGVDERGAYARADGSLWVDGKRIYEATGLAMRIVEGRGVDSGLVVRLDPSRDAWIGDHRPSWTAPALPMMVVADLLARGARADERVVGLRDVRLRGWVVCGKATTLRVERDGDTTRLLVEEGPDRPREVATARLVLGTPPEAPPSPAPLAGDETVLPYEDATMFHGPAFQLMTRLVRTSEGASSVIEPRGDVPPGRIHPAILDAATHGIPHEALATWIPSVPAGTSAFPAWIPELDLFGDLPAGPLRCEVRPSRSGGSPALPEFDITISGGGRTWCRMRLVEACFPRARLGSVPPLERRAFLRDRRFVPGVAIARVGTDRSVLSRADHDAEAWLPGGFAPLYGTDAPTEIARREHIAAAHALHPSLVPDALPLTAWDLSTSVDERGDVAVSGSGRGHLDIAIVRGYWERRYPMGRWPMSDLVLGLVERFLGRVVLEDPEAFRACRGRGVIYLANHQVAVESILFNTVVSALGGLPTAALAKIEHRGSWIGKLLAAGFSHPGASDPGLVAFFDRTRAESLGDVVGEMVREMRSTGRSILVHAEGTRALSCATPLGKLSSLFLEVAIAGDIPIVPVRFVGGLPVAPLAERIDFPLGMGRQDYWIGRPIPARDLEALPFADRRRAVIAAINGLGPSPDQERPSDPDPEFAGTVERLRRARGLAPETAVLRAVLEECRNPSSDTVRLLAASLPEELGGSGSPGDLWLRGFAGMLAGDDGR